MDGSVSPKLDSEVSPKEPRPEISRASKKRKVVEKTVVTVRMGTNNVGKLLKNEGPPSDFWSWRKYGQKPIKGSPYPRSYYKCSTSKGCSAKKQVERCKTDESLLIITYTCSHNHPGPDISSTTLVSNLTKSSKQPQENDDQNHDLLIDRHDNHDHPLSPPKEEEEEEEEKDDEHFYYKHSPIRCSQDMVIEAEEEDHFKGKMEKTTILCDTGVVGLGGGGGFLLDEEPILISNNNNTHQLMCFSSSSTPKNISELENDFFDELEELPTSSSLFTSFMGSHLSDEIRIPVVPS